MGAHVPPISAATPVWSQPGESGKPDSKLPIFSLRLRVGCLFYIFISTTECLPQPAGNAKGWVALPSVPPPCCAPMLELSKTPWCSNGAAAIGHITCAPLLGTVSSRLWPQPPRSRSKCHLQMLKSQQSKVLLSGQAGDSRSDQVQRLLRGGISPQQTGGRMS